MQNSRSLNIFAEVKRGNNEKNSKTRRDKTTF